MSDDTSLMFTPVLYAYVFLQLACIASCILQFWETELVKLCPPMVVVSMRSVDVFLFPCRVEGGQAQRRALPLAVQLPPQPPKAPYPQ